MSRGDWPDTLAGMKGVLRPDRYRVTAWLLGVAALAAPVLAIAQYYGDEDGVFAVLLWLAIPNAIAGLVLSWRWTDLPDPLAPRESAAAQRWQRASDRGFVDAIGVIVIQLVGVLVIQLVVAIAENDWDDFFEGPLLITALGAGCLLLAVLFGMFFITPIRMLLGWVGAKLAGGRVDSSRPAVALLLLIIVPLAIMIVLAGYGAPQVVGTTAKAMAGFVLFAQVLFSVQGDAGQQVFAWIARVLIVALALDLVWIIRIGLRRRAAQR